MGLSEYRKKRDFERTPEPSGQRKKKTSAKRAQRFVVQKHAARQLHYDFRLEHDGVLKSWAVPKGPSLDPSEKRLAVQVEDHPLDYGSFEGTIPEGEYGAGAVLLWDQGTWEPEDDAAEGLRRGRLSFRLDGEKLRGSWALVRIERNQDKSSKPNWLLIKQKDRYVREKSDIVETKPLSVTTGRSIEKIADGASANSKSEKAGSNGAATRATATGNGTPPAGPTKATSSKPRAPRQSPRHDPSVSSKPTARSAKRKRLTAPTASLPRTIAPQLATLSEQAPAGDEWIHELKWDGYRIQARIDRGNVVLTSRGGLDWTERFRSVADAAAQLPSRTALLDGEVVALDDEGAVSFQALQQAVGRTQARPLLYYVFDLLHLDGLDLTRLPLEERKARLEQLVAGGEAAIVRYSDHVAGQGAAFYEKVCERKLEGIVSKLRHAAYRPGRSRDWLKTKCSLRQEFVIVGYVPGQGARSGMGALLVGQYRENGDLAFAGKVGTGFDESAIADLLRRFDPLTQTEATVVDPPGGNAYRGIRWLRPSLVAEVRFSEWTRDGKLRHPVYLGLREDKPAREVLKEEPVRLPRTTKERVRESVEVAGVVLTHPDRVLYPEQGITKADLAEYYVAVSKWMLPHVVDRPLSLLRCPEGTRKACFYQKHLTDGFPAMISGVEITEETGKLATYPVVKDASGLVGLVQMGVLEFHPWNARADALETPDRLIFDFDPAPDVEFKSVVSAARLLRDQLAALKLESWVKTTGGKGLHVVVPIEPRMEWDEVRAYSRALAETCAEKSGGMLTLNPRKDARGGKIFLDYLRNSRGATSIAPYSTRAVAGAPVAVPVSWDDVGKASIRKLDVNAVLRRLKRAAPDPWAALLRKRQRITAGKAERVKRR